MVTTNENTYNYINLDYMNMMSEGDDSMKKIMLEMLLEELPVEIEKMQELLNAADWQELGSVSHKMKSTLAFVGNDAMTMANKDIELIAKNESDTDRLEGMINTLVELCPKTLAELNTEFCKL